MARHGVQQRDSALKTRIVRRDRALRAVRGFFADRGFVEADTHQLVPAPGTEPHIDALQVPLRTTLTSTETQPRWLITSPEFALKRVVAGGVPRVFQIVHVFRDGERTRRHHPEFTMLEWYRGGGTLDDVIDDTVGVIRAVAAAIGNASDVDVFAEPERVTVAAAFTHAGIDLAAALDDMRAGDPLALPRPARVWSGAGRTLPPLGSITASASSRVPANSKQPRASEAGRQRERHPHRTGSWTYAAGFLHGCHSRCPRRLG
jgi:lysyl-tRNA synthetase class 2